MNPEGTTEDILKQLQIDHIPPELLSLIFLHCVANEPVGSGLLVNRAPWTLGKVCHRWRRVCLGTPELWLNLPKLNTNSAEARNPVIMDLLRTSLALSSQMPLRLDLTTYATFDTRSLSILGTILAHFYRCRSLNLALNGMALPFLRHHHWNVRFLDSLSLRFFGHPEHFNEGLLDFLSDAPALKECTILVESLRSSVTTFPTVPVDFESFKLPWSQLTIFNATFISSHLATQVILNAPLLINCKLTSMYSRSGQDPTPCIPHLRLKSLALVFKEHNDAEYRIPDGFLESLRLPELTHFDVRYDVPSTWNLISLIDRSNCKLTTLGLSISNCDNNQALSFFNSVPQVEDLELRVDPEWMIKRGHMDALLVDGYYGRTLLPHLRHITIFPSKHNTDLHKFKIMSFIQDRTSSHLSQPTHQSDISPLETFTLVIDDIDALRQMFYFLEGWETNPSNDRYYASLVSLKKGLMGYLRGVNHEEPGGQQASFSEVSPAASASDTC